MGKTCYGCMKEKTSSPVCEHCGFDERQRNERHQLPIGIVLRQQYVVGRALGQGGFGITYIGWDMNLDMPVAIKEFYPNSLVSRDCTMQTEVRCLTSARAAYEDSKARFLREAQALAKFMDIPEIVRVQNFFEENGTAYIIMEYIQGMDLRKYLRTKDTRITAEDVLKTMKPVMAALIEVHKRGMIHRDISPDNIMVLPNGRIKLLDFGAVREVENPGVDKELTHSTQAILKHGFAPLEQYQAKGKLGPWTDVYALCATIYYCMTGNVPPEAHDRVLDEAALVWDQVPGLTKQQVETLEKGMALLPKDRITSVKDLYNGLFGIKVWEPAPTEEVKTPVTVPETRPETTSQSKAAVGPETKPEKKAEAEKASEQQENHVNQSGKNMLKSPGVWAAILAVLAIGIRFQLTRTNFYWRSTDEYDFLMGLSMIVFRVSAVFVPILCRLLKKKQRDGKLAWLADCLFAYGVMVWCLDHKFDYPEALSYIDAQLHYLNLITVNLCMLAMLMLGGHEAKVLKRYQIYGMLSMMLFLSVGAEYTVLLLRNTMTYDPYVWVIPAVLALQSMFLILYFRKGYGMEWKNKAIVFAMKHYPVILMVVSILCAIIIEEENPYYGSL